MSRPLSFPPDRSDSLPISPFHSKRLKLHFDAGSPLYIDAGHPNPMREEALTPNTSASDIEKAAAEETNIERRTTKTSEPSSDKPTDQCTAELTDENVAQRCSRRRRLDCVARVFLVLGLYMGVFTFMDGFEPLVRKQNSTDPFAWPMTVYQPVWGLFFAGVCLFGMFMIWGKWKRSPTTALIFACVYAFAMILTFSTAGCLFYLATVGLSNRLKGCAQPEFANIAGPGYGGYQPYHGRVVRCTAAVNHRANIYLAWAIAYTVVGVLSIIIVMWACGYRARLIAIREFECIEMRLGIQTTCRLASEKQKCHSDVRVQTPPRLPPIGLYRDSLILEMRQSLPHNYLTNSQFGDQLSPAQAAILHRRHSDSLVVCQPGFYV